MPLGCERRGQKLIQIKTPFDWILVHNGTVVFVDCKSLEKGSTFPSSLIKAHQAFALEATQHHGCQSGYIVHFKEHNAVVFFDAEKLKATHFGHSLKADEGIYLGTFDKMALGTLFI